MLNCNTYIPWNPSYLKTNGMAHDLNQYWFVSIGESRYVYIEVDATNEEE